MHDIFGQKLERIVLVGFGGLGREVFDYLLDSSDQAASHQLTLLTGAMRQKFGYIDDSVTDTHAFGAEIAYLGSTKSYKRSYMDRLIVTVGDPATRMVLWKLFATETIFSVPFIHPTARVSRKATIGRGVIIGPMAVVNAGATVGDNVLINCYASVGHGGVVGEHSVLSPYATVLGEAQIGYSCLLGTRATVMPQVVIGHSCIVAPHSVVMEGPSNHSSFG
jgi:UDP-3-O-[3-hydroxymyristoyl] glucosamine N-acyltransferase